MTTPSPQRPVVTYHTGFHSQQIFSSSIVRKVVSDNGTTTWYLGDEIHRDGDEPAVVYSNGDLEWCQFGEYHREGGKPARVYADGRMSFWSRDKLHRVDGPAMIRPDETVEFHIDGVRVTEEEFEKRVWNGR